MRSARVDRPEPSKAFQTQPPGSHDLQQNTAFSRLTVQENFSSNHQPTTKNRSRPNGVRSAERQTVSKRHRTRSNRIDRPALTKAFQIQPPGPHDLLQITGFSPLDRPGIFSVQPPTSRRSRLSPEQRSSSGRGSDEIERNRTAPNAPRLPKPSKPDHPDRAISSKTLFFPRRTPKENFPFDHLRVDVTPTSRAIDRNAVA